MILVLEIQLQFPNIISCLLSLLSTLIKAGPGGTLRNPVFPVASRRQIENILTEKLRFEMHVLFYNFFDLTTGNPSTVIPTARRISGPSLKSRNLSYSFGLLVNVLDTFNIFADVI